MLDITGRDAPIIHHEILSNPERRRWLIMTLLSCPGDLVVRRTDLVLCSLCNEPVTDIFSHLLAFCTGTLAYIRRKQILLNLSYNIQHDPESAAPTLLYWLFLSETRFRLQWGYVELFLSLRSMSLPAVV